VKSKREYREDAFFNSIEYKPVRVERMRRVEPLPGQKALFDDVDEKDETNAPEDERK
jgi:hypothetical protein